MPVRIRMSRGGAKKRPFFRIVVADSRRARDGQFIERIGTYNPMLPKDHPDRVKIDLEKAKEWIKKGAKPSDRIHIFLSKIGLLDKPIITEKTKKHLPKKKEEKAEAKPEAKKEEKAEAKPEAKKEEKAEAKPEAKKEEKAEAKPEAKKEEKAEAKPEAKKEEKAEVKPEAKKEEIRK
ncbi:MAG: 30S ribosomal protein S16 [Alphaproteobacteria bacterium MarineAlpha5_Bin9]|nr:MAG: 30S ribosomal protein S16 [Alphaproteobacteria bacterium MarineAlpha5_Bin9]